MDGNSKQLLKIAREIIKIASSKQFKFNQQQYKQLVKTFNSNGFTLKGNSLKFQNILKLQFFLDITLLTNGDVTICINDPGFIGIGDIGDTLIEYISGIVEDYKMIDAFHTDLTKIDVNFAHEILSKIKLSTK